MARLEKLLEMAYSGNLRALGRLLTLVENPGSEAIELLERLTSRAGKAQVIGFTGIPGAGKSTLVSRVIAGLGGEAIRWRW